MTTTEQVSDQPTVYLRIADSAIAFATSGEIVETVEYDDDGQPDWSQAGICDSRGAGGGTGYHHLRVALKAAERNALLVGYTVVRVPGPS